MKKFQKDLNNSTFMYQGRTVTASTHATDHKKKNVTLKSLGIGNKNAGEVAAKSLFHDAFTTLKIIRDLEMNCHGFLAYL